VLERRLGFGVPAQSAVVVGACGHRRLEPAQLGLELEEVARSREGVLAQRDVEVERWPLIVERDARSLCERDLPALDRGFTCDRT
jgi:hypothetical protein